MGLPNPASLDELVVEHVDTLRRLATRLTGRLEAAEEIVQEGLLRIVRGWRGFRGQAAFKTWAISIILHVFHDWLDKQREALPLAEVCDMRHADPVSCAVAEELRRHVAQRVSALPPRQREVLVLSFYEGHSPQEVAHLLDMQVANVYATLYQARQKLRVELAPYLTDSAGDSRVAVAHPSGACQENRHARS
jgi:RNA polymerase sigma-70 factor, ECF subfamily